MRKEEKGTGALTMEYPSASDGISWAAGFIDGEGTISAPRSKKHGRTYALHLAAAQTMKKPLIKLQATFGGGVYQKYKVSPPDQKPPWMWVIYGEAAKKALHAMLPYLLVKERQAVIALTFPIRAGSRGSTRLHPLARILQEECHKALKIANNRREEY